MNFNDPSGFLSGAVRPVVTMGLVASLIALTFIGGLSSDKLFDMGMMATAFWFGSRGAPPPTASA